MEKISASVLIEEPVSVSKDSNSNYQDDSMRISDHLPIVRDTEDINQTLTFKQFKSSLKTLYPPEGLLNNIGELLKPSDYLGKFAVNWL